MEHAFVDREVGKFQRNRRRGEDADKEDYAFYDITAWALPFSFNLDAYWTEDAGPAGEAVTDSTLPPPAAPGRGASAYGFLNDRPGAPRPPFPLAAGGFQPAGPPQPVGAGRRTDPRGRVWG